jgi:energy-coupling factor transporter ATP-binding protein EcfA2
MSGETFYGLREMVLPGPSQTSGYRSVLVIGTTGAGKSTLIRQLMGTSPSESFPATSASKTTVAETEIIMAPGPFYAVGTFMPLVEVRAYIEENVVNAALAIFDDRPQSEVRTRLLDHVDQRFRLRYLLGEGQPSDTGINVVAGGADSREDTADSSRSDEGQLIVDEQSLADQLRGNTGAILAQIVQLLEEAVSGDLAGMVDSGVATAETPEEELHVLLKDRLASNSTVIEIIEFLVSEVRARVEVLCPQDIVTSRDGWPLYWRCHRNDREQFLDDLRRFAGNDAADFGTLLTPLINGLRVRGPFHPSWAFEIPYMMLIDREGLGHTPDSVSSLPSSTTRMLDDVDTIVLVDNAQQPMQAAPVSAMRQIAAAGYGDKLVLCFSHFELVHGPNLPTIDARRQHVIASVDQVLTAIGNELGYPTERLLRQRLDRNLYLLSRLHNTLVSPEDTDTITELRWLLSQLRTEAEPLDLGSSRPVYSSGKLTLAVEDAVSTFLRYWELRLGVSVDPAVKPAHWSKIKALCVRYARRSNDEYESMRPAGDLLAALTDALRSFAAQPERWTEGQPEEDIEQQNYDAFTRRVSGDLRRLVNDRLFLDASELWAEARDVGGAQSAQRRASMVYYKILEPLVGPSGGVPMGDHESFTRAVTSLLREESDKLGIEWV